MAKWTPQHILITRTDGLGDLALSFPVARELKTHYPDVKITFLAKQYTRGIALLSDHIDAVVCWDELEQQSDADIISQFKSLDIDTIIHLVPERRIIRLAKQSGIPHRIGNRKRLYNWRYCNHLVWQNRNNSPLHATQITMKLLKPLLGKGFPSVASLKSWDYMSNVEDFHDELSLLHQQKTNLIMHPLSHGSGKEWPLSYYAELIDLLPESQFNIIVSGSAAEYERARDALPFDKDNVQNAMGRLSLEQFCLLINAADMLLASSTGPLHVAAALKKKTVTVYSSRLSFGKNRWDPLCHETEVLHKPGRCEDCRRQPGCACVESFTPSTVANSIQQMLMH